jgi:hypothetical protein
MGRVYPVHPMTLRVLGVGAALLSGSAIAQQPDTTKFHHGYESAVANARQDCTAPWSDHAFDSLRNKLPLGEERPILSMLANSERIRPKDKPPADLTIKANQECRAAHLAAFAFPPPQIDGMIEGVYRYQDALNAEAYVGKITGLSAALSGIPQSPQPAAPGIAELVKKPPATPAYVPTTQPHDLVQQAELSESDELQIALQANTIDVIDAYLHRHPDSPKQMELLGKIANIRRSEFNEWTLFDIGGQRIPHYMSFSSIDQIDNKLKSPSFYSRCQAENPHILRVLAIGDEFRERIGFCGTHEKFGKCLAQRFCNDELRWRNAGTYGSQPGSERVPNELGSNDGEILEESLGDDAGLDEGMISAHFAFDTGAVVGRFAM